MLFSARTTPQPSQNLVEPWWNPRGTLPQGRPGPETPKLSAVGEIHMGIEEKEEEEDAQEGIPSKRSPTDDVNKQTPQDTLRGTWTVWASSILSYLEGPTNTNPN